MRESQHRPVNGVILRMMMALAFAISLHLIYRDHLSPHYSYLGYGYMPPDTGWYMVGITTALLLAAMLPRVIASPADFVLWVLYLLAVAPGILVPHYVESYPPPQPRR